MFPVSCDRSMLRRLAPAAFAALGLVALVLAMPTYSFSAASAQTTVTPKYRLSVSVSGVPSILHLNQRYNYTLAIKNTGKKVIPKVMVAVGNALFLVPGSTSMKYTTIRDTDGASRAIFSISNLRAGSTRRISMVFVYNDSRLSGRRGIAIAYLVRGGKSICPNSSCAGTVVQKEGKKIIIFQ